MQHPIIDRIEATGYPYSERRQMVVEDGLGREVHSGDQMIVFRGEFYNVDKLPDDAIEILEQHGATYKIAK